MQQPNETAYRMRCPKCHQQTGRLLHDAARHRLEHDDIPDGLEGLTPVECENPECFHAWEIVTHAQVVRAMGRWTGGRSLPTHT